MANVPFSCSQCRGQTDGDDRPQHRPDRMRGLGEGTRQAAPWVAEVEARCVRKLEGDRWTLANVLAASRRLDGRIIVAIDAVLGIPAGYLERLQAWAADWRNVNGFLSWMHRAGCDAPVLRRVPRRRELAIRPAVHRGPKGRWLARRLLDPLRRPASAENRGGDGAKSLFIVSGIPGTVGSGTRALWQELTPLILPGRDFGVWPFEAPLAALLDKHPVAISSAARAAGGIPTSRRSTCILIGILRSWTPKAGRRHSRRSSRVGSDQSANNDRPRKVLVGKEGGHDSRHRTVLGDAAVDPLWMTSMFLPDRVQPRLFQRRIEGVADQVVGQADQPCADHCPGFVWQTIFAPEGRRSIARGETPGEKAGPSMAFTAPEGRRWFGSPPPLRGGNAGALARLSPGVSPLAIHPALPGRKSNGQTEPRPAWARPVHGQPRRCFAKPPAQSPAGCGGNSPTRRPGRPASTLDRRPAGRRRCAPGGGGKPATRP